MGNFFLKWIILFFLSIVFPRNIVQSWLSDNKEFIEFSNKVINFKYAISHPEYESEYENLTGKLITASENKFKLILGARTLYATGDRWVSYDSRTNQAIIQNPDSLLYNSIVSMTNYNELKKVLSVSILKKNTATIYNKGQKIKIKFNDKKISSILSEYSSIKVKFFEIEFDKQPFISDSIFIFSNNSAMMIDLRE